MLNDTPLVSVIMPCFNAAGVIGKTIDNLYQQSFQNFELIVIDDGSKDESVAILNKLINRYPRLTVCTQANTGPGAARNKGISLAKGDMIAFLDSDDSWHPDFLMKLHQALLNHPECKLAYSGWRNIGLSSNRCQPYIPPDYESGNKIASLLATCPWPIHAALTYKSAIIGVNGFDKRWLTAEDFDMWLKIATSSKIVRVPEVLAFYHHQNTEQISKNTLRSALNHWEVQKEFIEKNKSLISTLSQEEISLLVDGQLQKTAFHEFWHGDLFAAYSLFRKLISIGYIKIDNINYLMASLVPFIVFRKLVSFLR